MTWDTNEVNDNTVSRDEAIEAIKEMAREDGISGAFKTFLDGQLISTPSDLPERVDMDKVRVSAVLDNA